MEIGVFVFIMDEQNRVLCVRDVSREQKWCLPGGGLEFRELVTDCALREAREEAGVDIRPGRILGIFSQRKSAGIVVLVEGEILSGTPRPDGMETAECRFFSWAELAAMSERVKPAHLSMVHQVLTAGTEARFPLVNHFVEPPVTS